jgi:hypothetical protein
LTVEEQAAIMGYPKDFKFIGRVADQYAQIGKAVTAPTGAYLASIVAAGIRKGKRPPVLLQEEVTVYRDKIDRRDVDPYRGQLDLWQPPQAPPPAYAKRPRDAGASGAVRSARARAGAPPRTPTAARPRTNGAPGTPRRGSGYRMREMLVQGKSTEAILAVIHKEFPESTAAASDVSWNKRKLAQQGGVP